jgi:hypothetical protein
MWMEVPSTAILPDIPPMQRASYVYFSNAIVEKQAETRFTKTYVSVLAADTAVQATPAVLSLVNIVGTIYNQGVPITSGQLRITPRGHVTIDNHKIAPVTVLYTIVGTLDINLAPSQGTLYDVEYDSDPTDTVTPIRQKTGYFKDVWDIPLTGPVDVADL